MTKFFYAAALMLIPVGTWAQAPGSGGPEPGTQPDPTEVPIDGGASLVLVGGAAYALNRLRTRPR